MTREDETYDIQDDFDAALTDPARAARIDRFYHAGEGVKGDEIIYANAWVEGGEFVASVPEWGVAGFGATFDAATEDLLEQMRSYAADYLNRPDFYLGTDRRLHAPAIKRFARTSKDQQRQLLFDFTGVE